MTRRPLIWLAITGAIVTSLIAVVAAIGTTHDVVLSEAQIQERIDRKLSQSIERKSIKVTAATVRLGDGRAQVATSMEGHYLRQPFSASIKAVGVPRYERGAFYFTPDAIEVENFTFRGAAPAEKLKTFASGLKGKKLKEVINDSADDAETWLKAAAEDAASYALARVPVYTLKGDFKGVIIKAALEDVRIDGDKLNIRFSILQLGYTVAMFGLLLVLSAAFAVALMMHPGWFLVALVCN